MQNLICRTKYNACIRFKQRAYFLNGDGEKIAELSYSLLDVT